MLGEMRNFNRKFLVTHTRMIKLNNIHSSHDILIWNSYDICISFID